MLMPGGWWSLCTPTPHKLYGEGTIILIRTDTLLPQKLHNHTHTHTVFPCDCSAVSEHRKNNTSLPCSVSLPNISPPLPFPTRPDSTHFQPDLPSSSKRPIPRQSLTQSNPLCTLPGAFLSTPDHADTPKPITPHVAWHSTSQLDPLKTGGDRGFSCWHLFKFHRKREASHSCALPIRNITENKFVAGEMEGSWFLQCVPEAN